MAHSDFKHQPNGVADDTLFLAVVIELLSLLGPSKHILPYRFRKQPHVAAARRYSWKPGSDAAASGDCAVLQQSQ